MAGFRTHPLFRGSASFYPQLAAKRLAAMSDVSELKKALENLSVAAESDPNEIFRSQFRDRYLAFQAACNPGHEGPDPLQIVRRDFVPLIGELTESSWRSLIDRLQSLFQQKGTLSVGRHPYTKEISAQLWRPEIVIGGDNAQLVHLISDQVHSLFPSILGVFVSLDRSENLWDNRLIGSPFLNSKRVEIHIESLPSNSSHALRVCEERNGYRIGMRQDAPITSPILAYSLLLAGSKIGGVNRNAYLKFDVLTDPIKRSKTIASDIAYFENFIGSSNPHPVVRTAVEVQIALFEKEEKEKEGLRKAFQSLSLNATTIEGLLSMLEKDRIRFELSPLTHKEGEARILYSTPSNSIFSSRSEFTLVLNIFVAKTRLDSLTAQDLWFLIGKAYAQWIMEGRAGNLVTSMTQEVAKGVDLSHTSKHPAPLLIEGGALEEPLKAIIFTGKGNPIVNNPEVPFEIVLEYSHLLWWLNSLIRPVERVPFQSLREIKQLPDNSSLSDVLKIKSSLQAIRWIEADGQEEISIEINPIKNSEVQREAIFRGTLEALISMNPLETVLLANRVVEAIESKRKFIVEEGVIKDFFLRAEKAYSLEWIQKIITDLPSSWAWVKLLAQYEEYLKRPPEAVANFKLMGEGKTNKQISQAMIVAIRMENLSDPRKVSASLDRWPAWIVEYPKIFVQLFSEKGAQLILKPASTLKIITLSKAKLIYFDGEPAFSRSEWSQIINFILSTPDGFSWIDPRNRWITNRPELVVEEGDAAWYLSNAKYQEASEVDRLKYRKSLGYMRLCAEKERTSSPDPKSSFKELRDAYRALSRFYHPDARGSGGEDREGIFNNLKEAFEVLKKFHPEQ